MAMAMGLKSVVICFVLVAALIQSSEAATTHTVLDTLGWTIPTDGAVAYNNWAAKQNFAVGDTLLFNYTTGAHDVAEVMKTAYEDCTKTNTLSTETIGPTTINLTSAGEHYYICTFSTHCSNGGQKLAINVSSTTTNSTTPPPPGTTTASPPPPGGNTSPPPPSSAATPLVVAALPMITLFSIVLAMLH